MRAHNPILKAFVFLLYLSFFILLLTQCNIKAQQMSERAIVLKEKERRGYKGSKKIPENRRTAPQGYISS